MIWVGANDGPFHVTRDHGQTWKNITPPDLLPGGRVQYIEPSPHRPGSAYYAVYRYLLGDYHPYLYRTDDYGESWTLLTDGTNGIPEDWPTRVVREDPDREGLLYAGTEFGLFISFDNGARWQSFQLNMPNVPITDMKVHRKDLVISTQGRAFWILDNLSSLHQITPTTSIEEVRFYSPRDGYRTSTGANLLGPTIEYYLPAGTEGPVTIEIFDANGDQVSSYSGSGSAVATAGQARTGAQTPAAMMMQGRGRRGGGGFAARVTVNQGLNRFVWNVRHENGVTMPPGRYRVQLTVGEATMTEWISVLIDPRVAADGITDIDLIRLYKHNVRMREMVTEVRAISTRVQEAIEGLQGATGRDAETLNDLEAVSAKLVTPSIRYSKPGLVSQISYLSGATSRGDVKLSTDVQHRFEMLNHELTLIRREVERLLGSGQE